MPVNLMWMAAGPGCKPSATVSVTCSSCGEKLHFAVWLRASCVMLASWNSSSIAFSTIVLVALFISTSIISSPLNVALSRSGVNVSAYRWGVMPYGRRCAPASTGSKSGITHRIFFSSTIFSLNVSADLLGSIVYLRRRTAWMSGNSRDPAVLRHRGAEAWPVALPVPIVNSGLHFRRADLEFSGERGHTPFDDLHGMK